MAHLAVGQLAEQRRSTCAAKRQRIRWRLVEIADQILSLDDLKALKWDSCDGAEGGARHLAALRTMAKTEIPELIADEQLNRLRTNGSLSVCA